MGGWGLTGHKQLTDGLFQQLMQAERNIKADVQDAALEAGIAGQERIKWTIDHTESSLSPGKMDRNWTWKMNDSVDSKVERNGNTITIRAGWLQTKETYFLIQNYGGDLVRNGVTTTITPMNALWEGHNAMLDILKGWGLKIQ